MRAAAFWSLISLSIASAQQVSTNARCGPAYGGLTCQGSRFGNCCSQHSYCGSTNTYCGTGCNPAFGTCDTTSSKSTSSPSASPTNISPNARCGYLLGATGGYTCVGSTWGNCCSNQSYCGSTDAYCGTGCQEQYGSCSDSPTLASTVKLSTQTASSAAPSSTQKISINARCGSGFGTTCLGSKYGDCCSLNSYCGSTNAYCAIPGCQGSFGKCNGQLSSSSSSAAPVRSSTASSSGSATSLVTSSSSSSKSFSSSTSSSVASSSSSSSISSSSSSIASSTSSSIITSTSSSIASSSSSSISSSSSSSIASSSSSIVSSTPTPSSSSSCTQSTLLSNPSYEQGLDPWIFYYGDVDTFNVTQGSTPGAAHQGNYYLQFQLTSQGSGKRGLSIFIYQQVSVPATTTLSLSVWVRQSDSVIAPGQQVLYGLKIDNTNIGSIMPSPSSTYAQLAGSATITQGSHTVGMVVTLPQGAADQIFYVDDWASTTGQPVCVAASSSV